MDGHRAMQDQWNKAEQRAGDETKPLGPLPDLPTYESPSTTWDDPLILHGNAAGISLVDKGTDRLVLPSRRVRLRAS